MTIDPADGNQSQDPIYAFTGSADAALWNQYSLFGLLDVGNPAILDPDGSRSDIGARGGPGKDW